MKEETNWSQSIGIALIFAIVYVWMTYFTPKPTPKTEAELKGVDSTEQIVETTNPTVANQAAANFPTASGSPDSMKMQQYAYKYGAFAAAATGTEEDVVLENELLSITFSNKGGRIKDVFIKNYLTSGLDSANNEVREALHLLEDKKNRFGYVLNVQNLSGDPIFTQDLYFQASKSENTVTFRAPAGEGKYFEQSYTLAADDYTLDYKVLTEGLGDVLKGNNSMQLQWDNYLGKLEKSQEYERMYSSVYYKESEEDADYCDCRSDDTEELGEAPIDWFAHSNQFFNTTIIANNFKFNNFVGETKMYEDENEDLKLLKSTASLPLNGQALAMTIYTGPNEFKRLKSYENGMQDIIPFGTSIFGAINRWFIHPVFTFLSKYIGNIGLVILLLTFFVKALVYPLSYKMIHSQSKMQALKPHLAKLKEKHGDDQQAMSMETMKLYQEFGVNPLGSCFPMIFQMPIWFALYRFFPAAIEFRQSPFLWATDLSSYDAPIMFPFDLPLLGNHLSLFTILWVATTLWYTWYNMRHMDMSQGAMANNPAMKYMQFGMPIMFLFFFNGYASGLSAYLAFSNVFNIGQTLITKNYLIDHDKIAKQLEDHRAKPKKKSGFRKRFEDAMKEQQKQQALKEKGKKKK